MSSSKQACNRFDNEDDYNSGSRSTGHVASGSTQHLRLRVNSTLLSSRSSSSLQHRSSSNELVELEEQQRCKLNTDKYEKEDEIDLDRTRWNESYGNASSSSEEDDDESSNQEDDDDAVYASDTDESSVSGNKINHGGKFTTYNNTSSTIDMTCGIVEDALLQLTLSPEESKCLLDAKPLDTSCITEEEEEHRDDNDLYSPTMKKHSNSSKKRRFFSRFRRHPPKDTVPAVFDFEQYMLKREMNVTQEKWNALTVLPNPAYCIYFLLSAQWLSRTTSEDMFFDETAPIDVDYDGCLQHSSWHSMPALPPLPVIAVALGIIIHAPWSFLYHWTFAHTMSATQRTKHWSRRMDQSFIHVASAFLCYGSSGNVQYFLINLLYNLDCIRRQFRPIVRPKRNQMRIIISIIAYTLPLLKNGDLNTFVQLWTLFIISGYFFLQYPVGGWSHAVFHIVIAFVPPLLLRAATDLPVSKEQLFYAASCATIMNQ